MQAQMKTKLEFMLTIQSQSTPSRVNEAWLEKFARVNNEFKTECHTILTSPEWMTWRVQTESDVEIEIPRALAYANNTTILNLLNYHSDDPYTQADMIAKIQDIFDGRHTSTNVLGAVWNIENTQNMLHATPDSNGVHLLPSNVIQVACHILSSAKASDFMLVKAYSSVFNYVVEGCSFQLHMHHGKQSCIAWLAIFVDVLINIISQIWKGDVLEQF